MIFYECKDIIATALNTYLQARMADKGLDVRQVILQHREIVTQFKDSYSRSLLMTGAPKEEHPTYSNVPSTTFRFEIINRLEEVFLAMDLAPTQQRAHRLACQFRTKTAEKVFSEKQLQALEELPFVKETFEKASNWLVRARGIVVTMSSNFPLLQTVTVEEKEFSTLLDFDWYYDYSDDINVWRAGKARHVEKVIAIRAALEKNPSLLKVVEAIASANKLSTTFFTKLR